MTDEMIHTIIVNEPEADLPWRWRVWSDGLAPMGGSVRTEQIAKERVKEFSGLITRVRLTGDRWTHGNINPHKANGRFGSKA